MKEVILTVPKILIARQHYLLLLQKRIMKKNYLMMLLLHIYLKIYKTDIVNSIFHCSNSLTNQ